MQWHLNPQYRLTSDLAAMVAYVGSRGVHQPFRVDEANIALPITTSAGYLWPVGDSNINTNYSSIRGMFYKGRSYYNALETQLAKRMSHGFQAQRAFTWAKSIDTSSATLAGDAFGNSISSLDYFDLPLIPRLSHFNIAPTLVLNAHWALPAVKSWTGPGKWLTDGWETGLIVTATPALPPT